MSRAREAFEALRRDLEKATGETEESQLVVIELSRNYKSLVREERHAVDDLLGDWVLSEDENLRFDALALISEHGIDSALPALRRLADRFESASGPSTPYEWAKVNRIIGNLARKQGD